MSYRSVKPELHIGHTCITLWNTTLSNSPNLSICDTVIGLPLQIYPFVTPSPVDHPQDMNNERA